MVRDQRGLGSWDPGENSLKHLKQTESWSVKGGHPEPRACVCAPWGPLAEHGEGRSKSNPPKGLCVRVHACMHTLCRMASQIHYIS